MNKLKIWYSQYDDISLILISTIVIIGALMYNVYSSVGSSLNQREKKIVMLIQSKLESAYAEGQRDAANGDLRLNLLKNCWIKSPWDNHKARIYGGIKMCPNEN